jgi:hypothetical protein
MMIVYLFPRPRSACSSAVARIARYIVIRSLGSSVSAIRSQARSPRTCSEIPAPSASRYSAKRSR